MFGKKWRFEDIRILVGVTFLSAHTLPGRRLGCPGQISVEQTADICTWQILLEYSVNIPVYLTQLWNIFAKGEKPHLFSSERPRKNINFDENISGCWFRDWFRGSCVEFQTESDCLEKWTRSNVTAFHRLTRGKWKGFMIFSSWYFFIWRSRTLLMLLRQIVQMKYLWLCWTLMVDK